MQQREHPGFEQAQRAAAACARVLKERFGVREIYLFGSLAGTSPWHSRSDVDLAVAGLAPDRYFRALSELWDLLPEGLELDLVTLEDAPSELVNRIKSASIDVSPSESEDAAELAARIRREVKMPQGVPEDPKQALRIEIAGELASLSRIVDQGKLLLRRLAAEPDFVEINAAGKLVHDFYTGIERIFERITTTLGPGLPATGPGWHTQLLRSMEIEAQGIRSAIIDHRLALQLLDYLRFRHLFRHSYGYELQWEKVRPLVEGLERTLVTLRQQIDNSSLVTSSN